MSDEELLDELLLEWEDRLDSSQPATPDDLCPADRQHLKARLIEEIGKLERMRRLNTKQGSSTVNQPAVPSSPPPSLTGRFRPERFHAQGGLGVVYAARDSELDRKVAVKLIRADRDSQGNRRRFEREAELTGRLEHPGIVPIYGRGTDANGQPYYAMRFIRGESLRAAIEEYHKAGASPRTLRTLLARFNAACQTIAYAHSRGVIHRDIKPDNIMLGRHGETLVVDWGLARRLEETDPTPEETNIERHGDELTKPGTAMGTPAYMSPEQAHGDRLTPAGDIFSLGATLFCILAGEPPYRGDSAMQDARTGRYKPLRERKPDVPAPLAAICAKAMEVNPAARYATATLLAIDIDNWLAGEPVAARREPFTERAGRWIRKHPRMIAAGVSAVVFGLLGGLLLQAARERQRETEQRLQVAERDREIELLQTQAAKEKSQRLSIAAGELVALQEHLLDVVKASGNVDTETQNRALRLSISQNEKLLDETPGPALSKAIAKAYLQLSQNELLKDKTAAGLAAAERALAIAGQLPEADPDRRYLFARSHYQLAESLGQQGRIPEIQRHAEAAFDIAKALQAAEPQNPVFLDLLADCHRRFGQLWIGRGDRIRAEEHLRKAQALRRSVREPDLSVLVNQTRDTARLADNLSWLNEKDEASRTLEAAQAQLDLIKDAAEGNFEKMKLQVFEIDVVKNGLLDTASAEKTREQIQSMESRVQTYRRLQPKEPFWELFLDRIKVVKLLQAAQPSTRAELDAVLKQIDGYHSRIAALASAEPSNSGNRLQLANACRWCSFYRINAASQIPENRKEFLASAGEFARQAVAINRKLLEDCPGLVESHNSLVQSLQMLMYVQSTSGQAKEAAASQAEAAEVQARYQDAMLRDAKPGEWLALKAAKADSLHLAGAQAVQKLDPRAIDNCETAERLYAECAAASPRIAWLAPRIKNFAALQNAFVTLRLDPAKDDPGFAVLADRFIAMHANAAMAANEATASFPNDTQLLRSIADYWDTTLGTVQHYHIMDLRSLADRIGPRQVIAKKCLELQERLALAEEIQGRGSLLTEPLDYWKTNALKPDLYRKAMTLNASNYAGSLRRYEAEPATDHFYLLCKAAASRMRLWHPVRDAAARRQFAKEFLPLFAKLPEADRRLPWFVRFEKELEQEAVSRWLPRPIVP